MISIIFKEILGNDVTILLGQLIIEKELEGKAPIPW